MKPVQKIFAHKILMIKSALKDMQGPKFNSMLLILVVLIGLFSLSLAISLSIIEVNITNKGRLATVTPTAYKSEIRGVFVHSASMINPDWELIAQSCADYGINVIVIEATGNDWAHYYSNVIPYESEELAPAVAACHARGIELWASMNVMLSAYEGDGKQRRVVLDDGSTANWLCPTKQASRDLVKAIVEEMVTNYDIDGFNFDYCRYDTDRVCYCEECHQKFVADTGLTDVIWSIEVVPGGRYNKEFIEWRVKPITELVRDIRSWMLAIKPDLKFAAAAWTIFGDAPQYWRYWIGQDTADWIAKDYIDYVTPMAYTDSLTDTETYVLKDFEYFTGGPEGKIPLLMVLDTCCDAVSTPDNFKQRVDKVRELGCDGWIIFRYGGPGDGEGSSVPDIRDYLSILDMPDVFSLENIQVSTGETETTITWTTSLPTTSRVEYSAFPLFEAVYKYSSAVDFHYWDIDHMEGTIVEDLMYVTEHSITLTDLLPETEYYFRVQSEGSGGIITSKVSTFTTPYQP